MAEERGPSPTQEQLAKEVLEGKREITSSEPKMADRPIDSMSQAARMQALAAGAQVKSNQSIQQLSPANDSELMKPHNTPGFDKYSDPDLQRTPVPTPSPEPTPEPGG